MIPSRYGSGSLLLGAEIDSVPQVFVEFSALVDSCGEVGCVGLHPPRAGVLAFIQEFNEAEIRVNVIVRPAELIAAGALVECAVRGLDPFELAVEAAHAHLQAWVMGAWSERGYDVGVLALRFVRAEAVEKGACVARSCIGLGLLRPSLWW